MKLGIRHWALEIGNPRRKRLFRFLSLTFYLLLTTSYFSSAQDENACSNKANNKKALKHFEAAKNQQDWKKSRELLDKAIEEQPDFAEAYMFLAKRAKSKLDYKTAVEAYKKLVEVCPDYSYLPYYDLGDYLFDKKQYEEAIPYLKKVKSFRAALESKVEDSEAKTKKNVSANRTLNQQLARLDADITYMDSLLLLAKLYTNKVPFDPHPVKGVCSAKDEYLPIISPDNELALYIRHYEQKKRGDVSNSNVEEFTASKRINDNDFDNGELMPYPFNEAGLNQGAASITIDNNRIYITICKPKKIKRETIVNCDIYTAEKVGDSWGELKNLGSNVNDSIQWDSQPSISPDGKTLYFASMRDSVHGTSDIYKCEMGANGNWGKAVPLGAPINTIGNEKSPFIHPDNKTLYFASDAHPGLGGYDIFYSKKDSLGHWGKPKNLGFPINTDADELGFFVSTDGKTGYFASNKIKGGPGGWDVYAFPLYEAARPGKVLFMKGDVKKEESDTNSFIKARIEFKDLKTHAVKKIDVDSVTGHYVAVMALENDLVMTTKQEGYAYESKFYSASDSTISKPLIADLVVKQIKEGSIYQLNNIYYKTNSAELTSESKFVLEEFVDFLNEHPHMTIEIRGHTDNVGSTATNLALSTDRSYTVFDFLTEHGIEKHRLSYKGFGPNMPVASNDTEDGRAKNRRTEFVIIKK